MRNAKGQKVDQMTINKTVLVDGVKTKVSIVKTRVESILAYTNEDNYAEGKIGIIRKSITTYNYNVLGKDVNAELISYLKNTRTGTRMSQEFTLNGQSFGDNEKKVIEAIINN